MSKIEKRIKNLIYELDFLISNEKRINLPILCKIHRLPSIICCSLIKRKILILKKDNRGILDVIANNIPVEYTWRNCLLSLDDYRKDLYSRLIFSDYENQKRRAKKIIKVGKNDKLDIIPEYTCRLSIKSLTTLKKLKFENFELYSNLDFFKVQNCKYILFDLRSENTLLIFFKKKDSSFGILSTIIDEKNSTSLTFNQKENKLTLIFN